MRFLKSFFLLPVMIAALAAPALAQTNVGVMHRDRILAQSDVGVHIRERLAAIQAEMTAELEAINTPLQQDIQAFVTETANMTEDAVMARPDLVQRRNSLAQRGRQVELASQIRGQEYAATEQQALTPVFEELEAIAQEVVTQRGLHILIERTNVYFASADVDISDDVIALLNQRLQTVPVNRVRIPQQQAGAAAPQ